VIGTDPMLYLVGQDSRQVRPGLWRFTFAEDGSIARADNLDTGEYFEHFADDLWCKVDEIGQRLVPEATDDNC